MPRSSDTLEFQFSHDLSAAAISLAGPTGLCTAGCPLTLSAGTQGPQSLGLIDLGAPLPNAAVYTITLTATTAAGCEFTRQICVAALAGDFDSDGSVTPADKAALVGFVFQPIAQSNAGYDLQVDGGDSGVIDVTDVAAWAGFFGTTVAGGDCP